jgi:hypothetical protein
MHIEDVVAVGIFSVVAAFFIFALAQAGAGSATNTACLHRGWPQSEVTWNFERYCHKRIEQTDSVIPLTVLER